MEGLFGRSNVAHGVAKYGKERTADWISRFFVYGRYVLELYVPVKVDLVTGRITGTDGPALILLNQVSKVEIGPPGGTTAHFDAEWRLSGERWSALVESKGDWASIGIPIRSNAPIQHISEYRRAMFQEQVATWLLARGPSIGTTRATPALNRLALPTLRRRPGATYFRAPVTSSCASLTIRWRWSGPRRLSA